MKERGAEHETNFELVWLPVETLSAPGVCLHKLSRKSSRLAFNLISFQFDIAFRVAEVSRFRSCRLKSRKPSSYVFLVFLFDTSTHRRGPESRGQRHSLRCKLLVKVSVLVFIFHARHEFWMNLPLYQKRLASPSRELWNSELEFYEFFRNAKWILPIKASCKHGEQQWMLYILKRVNSERL